MTKRKNTKPKGVSNLPLSQAMHGLNSSSAASPQESRNKRLRTKQAIIRKEIKDAE
jgi:hypothetical protein